MLKIKLVISVDILSLLLQYARSLCVNLTVWYRNECLSRYYAGARIHSPPFLKDKREFQLSFIAMDVQIHLNSTTGISRQQLMSALSSVCYQNHCKLVLKLKDLKI